MECSSPDLCDVAMTELLNEMIDVLRLTRMPQPDYRTLQFSSYDRRSTHADEPGWFENLDHSNFLRVWNTPRGEEYVMADAEGPGVMQRIWSASPRGTIRVYIDSTDEPVLEEDMTQLLGGEIEPLTSPYAYVAARGYNLYFPVPYAERLIVTMDDPPGAMEAFYYHVGYRQYHESVQVEPFTAQSLSEYASRIGVIGAELLNPSDASGSPMEFTLTAAQATFETEAPAGGGVITSLVVQPSSVEAAELRRQQLVIRFDGVETVRSPIAELFGAGPGIHKYDSYVASVTSTGELTLRWPMAFEQSVEFELVGDGAVDLDCEIRLIEFDWDDTSMHFYAKWRSIGDTPTHTFLDMPFLEVTGTGLLVGSSMNIANPVGGWWGEGDEKIFIDREAFPSFFGTGTEDYYGYAWVNQEFFERPYHAQPNAPEGGLNNPPHNFGRTSNLRWHVMDPLPFAEHIRFDMELQHWDRRPEISVNVDTISYWYASPGSTDTFTEPTPDQLVVPPLPEDPIL